MQLALRPADPRPPGAVLAEIAYALDTPQLDGVGLLASVEGRYLGDAAFDPIFVELNRRKAVLFIHPNVPLGTDALRLAMPGALIEFVFDTTRAVANLVYSGTLERYPGVRIILPHAGGTVPFLAWRIALGEHVPALKAKAPQGAIAYLRRLYYETALSSNPFALAAVKEIADPSRLLFGSDHPYASDPLIGAEVQGLATYPGFDAAQRERIERDNALALFPRLRRATAR